MIEAVRGFPEHLDHLASSGAEYAVLPSRFRKLRQAVPADADRKLSELRYTRALRALTAKKAEFPDLSAQSLSAAYPGRCQSLTQVLSTTDARLSALTEKES